MKEWGVGVVIVAIVGVIVPVGIKLLATGVR